jgi:hypothetical protein
MTTLAPSTVRRVLLERPPYRDGATAANATPWIFHTPWSCSWIAQPNTPTAPFVCGYRLRVTLAERTSIRMHVSADERYELFVDGVRVGRGPERGMPQRWFYETYDADCDAGTHVIAARVWSLGPLRPWAQTTLTHGFILAPDNPRQTDLIGTGVAPWQSRLLPGYAFSASPGLGTGGRETIDGAAYAWDWSVENEDDWQTPIIIHSGNNGHESYALPGGVHAMYPAQLPPMRSEQITGAVVRSVDTLETDADCATPFTESRRSACAAWQRMLRNKPAVVSPRTRIRVLIDLDNYECVYPELIVSGGCGARVSLRWCEALRDAAGHKGNRDEVNGRSCSGPGTTYFLDGGRQRRYTTLWWEAGRYLELQVCTAGAPLTIERLAFERTGYPFTPAGAFRCSDARINNLLPMLWRSLQACAHETYMDCPFYEQLMYVGDTRLECLTTYVWTRDFRLPRKALHLFDVSRTVGTPWLDCYVPTDAPHLIPSFCLWWIGMVHDYAHWRDDPATVCALLPGVRATLDLFLLRRDADGFITTPPGSWAYLDVALGGPHPWIAGTVPDDGTGINAILNLIAVHALERAAELESVFGERALAVRNRRAARDLLRAICTRFLDPRSGVINATSQGYPSEHAQSLAVLSDALPACRRATIARALLERDDLACTNIFFTHYLFEAYRRLGRPDRIMARLADWFALPARGLRTTPESFEPQTRSDCHAWGAHPLYHCMASLLGIRPDAPGFRHVMIAPQFGDLTELEGVLPHPAGGDIRVRLERRGTTVRGDINLPRGLTGIFRYGAAALALKPGTTRIAANV